jgi:Protein of unknown function (DUF664)
MGTAELTVSESDFLWFVDLALDQMVAIVSQLGDARANRRPDVAGANSPFAILTHCLGVMEFWGGSMVADRTSTRDRQAEFVAEGSVQDLTEQIAIARRQLASDISGFDSQAPPAQAPAPEDVATPFGRNMGGVLLHILEELFQHLGQMEISRDMLLADG